MVMTVPALERRSEVPQRIRERAAFWGLASHSGEVPMRPDFSTADARILREVQDSDAAAFMRSQRQRQGE
jgi:hypothetical protein